MFVYYQRLLLYAIQYKGWTVSRVDKKPTLKAVRAAPDDKNIDY